MRTRRFETMNRAIRDAKLTSSEKVVLWTLLIGALDSADEICRASVASLARMTSLSRRSVIRIVGRLESIGWVRVTRENVDGATMPNAYQITPPRERH